MDQKIVFGMGAVILMAALMVGQLAGQGVFTTPHPPDTSNDTAPVEVPEVDERVVGEPDFDEYLIPDSEYYEGETKTLQPTEVLTSFSGAIASATPPLANFAGRYAIAEWNTMPPRRAGAIFDASSGELTAVIEGDMFSYHYDSRLLIVNTDGEDLFFIMGAGLEYVGSKSNTGEYIKAHGCAEGKEVATPSFGVVSYPTYCPEVLVEPLNHKEDVAS